MIAPFPKRHLRDRGVEVASIREPTPKPLGKSAPSRRRGRNVAVIAAAATLFLALGGALFFYFAPRGNSIEVQGSSTGDGDDDAPLPRYNFERDHQPSNASATGSAEHR
jgi:hypothetical protein